MDVNPQDLLDQEVEVVFTFRLMKATRLHKAWMLRGVSDGQSVAVHVFDNEHYELRLPPKKHWWQRLTG